MDIPTLLGLRNVDLEMLAKIAYKSRPGGVNWTEEMLLAETEKTAQLIMRSINVHLNNNMLEKVLRDGLANVSLCIKTILHQCQERMAVMITAKRRQVELQAEVARRIQQQQLVNSQLAQISQDIDTPD